MLEIVDRLINKFDLSFIYFELISLKNGIKLFIWLNEEYKIVGYKCNNINRGSYNLIYKTIEYHEFDEYVFLNDIKQSIIDNKHDFEKSFRYKVKNLVFRINIEKKEDLLIDSIYENVFNKLLSDITPFCLKPYKMFYNEISGICSILVDRKYELNKIIDMFNKPNIKKIYDSRKRIVGLENSKKIEKENKKIEKLQLKIELNIFIMIQKISKMIESLNNCHFRHGDLKINNIVCDHTKNIEELKLYMIDFGNSGMDLLKTFNYTDYISHNDYDNNIEDISFFIIHMYVYSSSYLSQSIKKESNNIISYKLIFLDIIEKLYEKNCIIKIGINEIIKKDEWALYYNNKTVYRYSKYKDDINRLLNFKMGLKKDYKNILSEMIDNHKSKINN